MHSQPGSLDTSFDPGTGANATINTIALQADGKIIIGGDFTTYNGVSRNRIARLNADGSLDTSFNVGTGINLFSGVQSITIDLNGKIIVTGGFTKYNNVTKNHIVRLNTDGSIDTTFLIGTGADQPIISSAVQPDGKIILGGGFTKFNGITNLNKIVRLNDDGTIDASFNAGTGLDNFIRSISIQADGKIIIGGEFNTYNGLDAKKIARLNSDGTLDLSFNTGTGFNNTVWSAKIQGDGKIVIGGLFTIYNGTYKNYLTRLNTDGTTDGTFDIGTGANNVVRTVALQYNDKILFGGNYITYNSEATNRFSRLMPTGLKDIAFACGDAADNSVNGIAIQPDGHLIMVGNFTSYNGVTRNRIARVFGDVVLSSLDFEKNKITIYPNPSKNILNFSTLKDFKIDSAKIFDTTGKLIFNTLNSVDNQIDISNLSNGIYFLSLQNNENGSLTQKFIKN